MRQWRRPSIRTCSCCLKYPSQKLKQNNLTKMVHIFFSKRNESLATLDHNILRSASISQIFELISLIKVSRGRQLGINTARRTVLFCLWYMIDDSFIYKYLAIGFQLHTVKTKRLHCRYTVKIRIGIPVFRNKHFNHQSLL